MYPQLRSKYALWTSDKHRDAIPTTVRSANKKSSYIQRLSKIYPQLTAFMLGAFLITEIVLYQSTNPFVDFQHLPSSSSAPSRLEPPQFTSCGGTPAEARQRNCSFDLLSFSWQVSECYDSDLLNAFLSYRGVDKPWKYYEDPWNVSSSVEVREVPAEIAALGEQMLYVSWEYHIVHCTFMYMAMHRAYTVRGYIDSHLDDWDHTKHCQRVILKQGMNSEDAFVEGKLRFPECRIVTEKPFSVTPDGSSTFVH